MSTNTRKKSVTSSSGLLPSSANGVDAPLHIDTPVAMNTMLNKQATTSLYQQCVVLRNRLLRVHDFAPYLELIDKHEQLANLDVVHRLWHTLALGVPLCFLFNLLDLPVSDRIQVSTDPDEINLSESDAEALKVKKRAAALFIIGIQRLKNANLWTDEVELFTVTELTGLDNKDTNGFVKVVATTSHLLDKLPEHVWKPQTDSPPQSARDETNRDLRDGLGDDNSPPTLKAANAQDMDRNNIIRELIETERKYIQDLEVMHNYAKMLMAQEIVNQDTIHHLFPGLNKLLDFQRKFSIELEQQYELPWEQQRWGRCFSSNEPNFQVYEPYCANYTTAAELVLAEEPHLMALAHVINPKSELPAFLIKPVQRICKYPLLLESLVKRCPTSHEFYDELVEGAASCKQIADKVNEAQRRAENVATVKLLEKRVEDWKGHALSNFGELLLDDVFMVTKSEVDREYHVFLFEKIILCCKDATAQPNKKVGKSNSILKKQSTGSAAAIPGSLSAGGAAAAKKKTTPLLLKGRIFLNNVTQAVPVNKAGSYSLQVWWRGDDELEYFTLKCRTEEQAKQWEVAITRMIKEVQAKREEKYHNTMQNGYRRGHGHERDHSLTSSSVTTLPAYSQTPGLDRRVHGSYSDLQNGNSAPGYWESGPQSAHPYSSEFYNEDDTENEGHSYGNGHASESGYSGRNTPSGMPNGRRAVGQSMPPERESPIGYAGHRTRTEDPATFAQWASQRQNGLPANPSAVRPQMNSRNMSTGSGASGASMQSMQSEASFGNGRTQPGLRSQYSASRLRTQYDERGGYDEGRHAQGNTPRMRAISNPTGSYASQQAYNQYAPPVPIAPQGTGSSQSSGYGVEPSRIASGPSRERMSAAHNQSSMGMRRPISGGSSDTDNSGEQSPENGPLHHISTTAGGTLRGSRSQIFNGHSQSNNSTNYGSNNGYGSHAGPGAGYGAGYQNNNAPATNAPPEPPVKIKVYWLDDLFVIMVPRSVTFSELVQRVQKKIRLCGGGNTDGPLRLKYDDEDGDRISLSTDEELQMAFDMTISRTTGQGQLILRVN